MSIINKITPVFFALIFSLLAFTTSANEALSQQTESIDEVVLSIDDRIESYMEPVTNVIMDVIFVTIPIGFGKEVPFVLIWLLFGAVFFTFYFKFISISGFKHAIDVVKGKFDDPKKKEPLYQ